MRKFSLLRTLFLLPLAFIVPIAGAVASIDPGAPPRVPSEQACRYLADYALVARALAEERAVSNAQAESILGRIYLVSHPLIVDVEGRIRLIAKSDKRPAQQFSMEFLHECMAKEGDVTRFLGVSL
jgi:hypothetical protein